MLFEQESYAFGRFLPGFLLPGPLTYSSRTDSFITVSSCRQVESYKYVFIFSNYCIFWCCHLVCKQIKVVMFDFYCLYCKKQTVSCGVYGHVTYLHNENKFASFSRVDYAVLKVSGSSLLRFSLICSFGFVCTVLLEQDNIPSSSFNVMFILMQIGVSLKNLLHFLKRFGTWVCSWDPPKGMRANVERWSPPAEVAVESC